MRDEMSHDPFYVGYMPLPGAHRLFLLVCVPLVLVTLVGAAAAIAISQRDPGQAIWDLTTQRSWSGLLEDDPYPMLTSDDGQVYLVVGMGKFGEQERVSQASGAQTRLTGWLLERDGRQMIELDASDSAIEVLDPRPSVSSTPSSPSTAVTLVGEIVDGKCFLGAMKPGDGKGHKACAILCIEGGLPPMFATPNADGTHAMALLLVDGTTELSEDILDLVAEPVVVRGTMRTLGGLDIIEVASKDIAPHKR